MPGELALLPETEGDGDDTRPPWFAEPKAESVAKVSPVIISAEDEQEEKKTLTGITTCLYAGRFCELPSFTQITLNCVSGWELRREARVCD